MLSPAQQVCQNLGIKTADFNAAAHARGTASIDPLRDDIHRIVTNRAARRRGEISLNNKHLNHAHEYLKSMAEETEIPHAMLLSAMMDKYLDESKGDGDEGDGDTENPNDDDQLAMAEERLPTGTDVRNLPPRSRAYQMPPSPIDRNPRSTGTLPRSPTLAEQHRGLHAQSTVRLPGGGRLLLNVTAAEMRHVRTGRA